MTEDDWRTIEEAVATHDPDRLVATFFAPAKHRRALLAVAAFEHELARVGAAVREPMAGHVRLAWWREQIAAIYDNGKPATPVAEALAHAIRSHALPRERVDATIDARARDLDEVPFGDEAALEAHADATTGNIARLSLHVLGLPAHADAAVRHTAIATAYAAHLRELAAFARLRRCRLPLAWLDAERLNAEDVFGATETSAAFERIFARAQARIEAALSAANAAGFARSALPALSCATLARIRAEPFAPRSTSAWQRVLRLSLANLIGRL